MAEKRILHTKVCDLFHIRYPIIGGAMMYLSKAELVAAVSEAGGLGVLASAMYPTKDEFAVEIRRLKTLTKQPFAVNLNLFPAMRPINNRDYLDVIEGEGIKIVETSGHELPEELAKDIKSAGLLWMHKCAAVRHALRAQRLGADAVTVVGYENGGATGKFDVTTLVLVPATKEAVDIPVIGGGGVCDGRGLAALLALGADGVIIGSRLLLTKECGLHPKTVEVLLRASVYDTCVVMKSIGMTHRVLKNKAAEKVLEIEAKGGGFEELLPYIIGEQTKKVYFGGEVDAGMLYVSQAVGLMKDVKSVREVISEMVDEACKIFARFTPQP